MAEEKKPGGEAAVQPPPPAIQLPEAPPGKVTLRVNGKDHFVDEGHRNLIEALKECGVDVPHFCYHGGLRPDGNCRMCYVSLIDPKSGKPMGGLNLTTWQPQTKMFISCMTPLDKRGMVVDTESEAVQDGRKLIMEFMLANHPLDCPVCDKSGECDLQDYSFDHGRDHSRFDEKKNVSDVRELGPSLMLWQTRCIICTRCVRFLDDVTGTGELTVTNRGDHSEIETFPGKPVDNPMMGNLVDICPVGAIIDKDFMFQARVWWLKKTATVSPVNSLGENITIEHIDGNVKRIRPEVNLAVNGHWIADESRYDYRWLNASNRLVSPMLNSRPAAANEAIAEAVERIKKHSGRTAIVGSLWATLEELEWIRRLAEKLGGAPVGLLEKESGEDQVFPGYVIPGDKNPNRKGAGLVFGGPCPIDNVVSKLQDGSISCLLVVNAIPQGGADLLTVPFHMPSSLVDAAAKADDRIVVDVLSGPLSDTATVLLPSVTYAEKDGVYINKDGRVQKLDRVLEAPVGTTDDVLLLQRLYNGLVGDTRVLSAAQIFRELADVHDGLKNMTHWKIRKDGLPMVTEGGSGK